MRFFGDDQILLGKEVLDHPERQRVDHFVGPQFALAFETGLDMPDVEMGGPNQLEHVLSTKETQMSAVENPRGRVAEIPQNDPAECPPVADVRQADDEPATGLQKSREIRECFPRVPQVLEDIATYDDIEALRQEIQGPHLDIRYDESVNFATFLGSRGQRHQFHPNDFAGFSGTFQGNERGASARPNLEDPTRWIRGNQLEKIAPGVAEIALILVQITGCPFVRRLH